MIIPSARPGNLITNGLLDLPAAHGTVVRYIVVVDAPEASTPQLVNDLRARPTLTLLVNSENLGAQASRNRGLDAASADWVLFLDDDVVPDGKIIQAYAEAIERNPGATGFVGITQFGSARNSFTKGVWASDILTFFDIAKDRRPLGWGVTANLLVRRSAIGAERFSTVFPKRGGGEDIDFCIRVLNRTGGSFVCVPEALVHHPWWDGGRRQYRRFARWAFGDSRLPRIHPRHAFRNAPNFAETSFVVLGGWPFLVAAGQAYAAQWALWLGVASVFEVTMESIRMRFSGKRPGIVTACEATAIRTANDIGRLWGNLKRLRLWGIGERFDYFLNREHISYERFAAITKTAVQAFVLTAVVLVL